MEYIAPTYNIDTKQWEETEFESKMDIINFLRKQFKYPSEYNIKYSNGYWNEKAMYFDKHGFYPKYVKNSKDYRDYWISESKKSEFKGFTIWKSEKENLTYCLPGLYYWYLNYCPIPNKLEGKPTFSYIWDSDLHFFLYLLRCQWEGKFGALVKKRQWGSSLKNMAAIANSLWFGEAWNAKVFAIDESQVADSWVFLEMYSDHINKYTAFKRGFEPKKTLNWVQRVKTKDGSRFIGRNNKATGISTKISPTKGVGGCNLKGTLIKGSNGVIDKIENFKIGDNVLGADGTDKKIQHIFEGKKMMYKISQTKGDDYIVTEDHRLYLHDHEKNKNIEITPVDFIKLSNYKQTKLLSGFKYQGLKGEEKKLLVDPYYLGAWLGDGYTGHSKIIVNKTKDVEICDYIKSLENTENLIYKEKRKEPDRYNDEIVEISLCYKVNKSDSYYTKLKVLGIFKNKRIPKCYFASSRKQRLEVLAGLIDTDGYYNKRKNRYEISIKKEDLRNDIKRLCVDLGLSVKEYKKTSNGKTSTVYKKPTTIYCLHVKGDIKNIPVKIKRKIALKNDKLNYSKLTITEYGVDEYYGFECEDHLYVLADGTVTHNSARLIFGEEAGTNKTLKKTHNYLKSNVAIGGVVTGLIIYAGAVGELEHADDLKDLILNPVANGILSVENKIEDDIAEFGILETGLFAPEWWNYISVDEETQERIFCYDKWGNTNKEKALKLIEKNRKKTEDLKPEDLVMEKSQHPLSLKEAFSFRKESIFPQNLLSRQLHRIERGDYPYTTHDLERTSTGIEFKKNLHEAIVDWPYKPKKGFVPYGCVQVWEEPEIDPATGKPPWGMYFAGVDVIQVDQSTTSDSLFSIHIFKNITEVVSIENGKETIKLEGDKIVAKYVGRKKTRKDTNETGFMLIEKYNAFAAIENNFDNFIQQGIRQQKQKYMALKDDLPFLRELSTKGFSSNKDYGVRTNETIWLTQFEDKSIEYIKEQNGTLQDKKGKELKIIYGVEKVPDRMLVKEWLGYDRDNRKKKRANYDNMVSFGLALSLAKSRQANHLISKVDRSEEKQKNKITNTYTKQIIKNRKSKYRRRGFKNIR